MEAKQILEKNIKMRGLLDFGNYSCVGIPYENALNAVNEALCQPPVSGECEHPYYSVLGDGEMQPAKCLKCGKVL